MLRALIILMVSLWSVDAWATTFYVKTTGSDANSCAQAQSPSTPKLTPADGCLCLNGSGADATLDIDAGLYTGAGARLYETTCTIPSGTSGHPTIIRGAGTSGCALSNTCGTILRPNGVPINLESKSYVRFQGLEVDGQSNASDDSCARLGGTGDSVGGNIEFIDVELHHCTDQGLFEKSGYADITHTRVRYHHNGTGGNNEGHGCYCSADRNTFTDSRLDHNGVAVGSTQSYGVQFFTDEATSGGVSDDNLLLNVEMDSNSAGGLAVEGANTFCYNCIIHDNADNGIEIGFDPSSGFRCYFCTIEGNGGWGIYNGIFAAANNTEIKNSHIVENASGAITTGSGTGLVQTTNRTTGALTDCTVSSSDYHQKGGSSCLGQGTALVAVLTDFYGTTRDDPPDIGATETYAGSGGGPSNSSFTRGGKGMNGRMR